jgi:alkylation response protein AidB-like acyl-CoA dehydrogenase
LDGQTNRLRSGRLDLALDAALSEEISVRLAATEGLTDTQDVMLKTVRDFVDREILPNAGRLERADEYPQDIVDGMREMGLFGLTIPEQYGGLGESMLTYALVVEEIARGWMSVSGVINTHFIVAYLVMQHGSQEQKERLLPAMATGELRGAFSMSEPNCGSDVSAITSRAVRDGDDFVINGQKMWLTNGARAGVVATLLKTDEGSESVYRNMTTILVEKEAGFGDVGNGITIPGKISKMGYKGVETTEMLFDGTRVPASAVLGGESQRGQGFYQMMDGVEVGRVNVAARACGISIRAFELAMAYVHQRRTFGKALAEHQAIQFKLAEMASKIEAGHALMVRAARLKDAGKRNDVEAGIAKLMASEYCSEVTQESFRIHGGYGYSTEFEIERLMREAPFLLIGEGTSEIQKTIISRGLLRDFESSGR